MRIRAAAGIAFAVIAAVVIGVFLYGLYGSPVKKPTGDIRTFESYNEIRTVLNGIEQEEPMVYANGGVEMTDDLAEYDAAAEPGVSAAKGADRSDTYVQVSGVDEADIIKTDGEYIYYASRLGYDVVIAKATDGKVKDAAVITEEETGISADELYLTDGRLVIVGNEWNRSMNYYTPDRTMMTAVCIYDVTDPEKPELIGRYRQTGSSVSSRVSDGYLYLVTTDYLNTGETRIVPEAGSGNKPEKLAPEQIFCFPDPTRRAYAVIGSVKIDSKKDKIKSQTKAVLGSSDEIYCTGSTIYMADYHVDFVDSGFDRTDEYTCIIKAEISKGNIDFAKQGSVRGEIHNQFSMDENDGYFRVATTAFIRDKEVNYLYVLDENLKVVGKVKGFAAGEEIKAVRFMGDTAYVITYEQTDPLFVIDLKNPAAPKMLGSVEITGFSSLLVPEGENRLIGIGSSTSEEEFGEVEDGIKIALFDISDPKEPKVLDSMTYKDYSSDVQYDHKALTVNEKEGWYAIPYMSWNDESGGVLQFAAEGDKLVEINAYENEASIDRCLYIGNHLYGLEDMEDHIVSWELIHK